MRVNFYAVIALPEPLEPDSIYYVRKGDGFDIHVTNGAGVVTAYSLNADLELDGKVDKELGYSLLPNTEITRLATIHTGATKNRADILNADKVHTHTAAQVSGTTVYVDTIADLFALPEEFLTVGQLANVGGSPAKWTGSEGGWIPYGPISAKVGGAMGDGVTDDATAINAAVEFAGENNTVYFPKGTYIVGSQILALSGQTWEGNGSTLKRKKEHFALLTEPKNGGSNPYSVQVNDVSGFYVGQEVTFRSSTIPEDSVGSAGELRSWPISAISPGVITLSGGTMIKSYVAGDKLITSSPIISHYLKDNVRIKNLVIDGNMEENTTWRRWEVNSSVVASGDYCSIEGCTFINATSDCVIIQGRGNIFRGNFLLDAWGNGVHLSGTDDTVITENFIENVNIGGATPGHADGAILASNLVFNTTITKNTVSRCNGYPAVGSYQDEQNSGLTVSDNYFYDMAVAGGGKPVIHIACSVDRQFRTVITGNRIVNCGAIAIETSSSKDFSYLSGELVSGTAGIIVANNYFERTGINILNATVGTAISGNSFLGSPPNDYYSGRVVTLGRVSEYTTICSNTFLGLGSESDCIFLVGTNNANISNNSIEGFRRGVNLSNSGLNLPEFVKIHNNIFKNQTFRAIDNKERGSTFTRGGTGVVISDNSFISDMPTVDILLLGRVSDGAIVENNYFYMYREVNARGVETSPTGGGAIIKGNAFRIKYTNTGSIGSIYAVISRNANDFVEYNYSSSLPFTGGAFLDITGSATFTNNRENLAFD